MIIEEGKNLKQFNTFGIEVYAKEFIEISKKDDAINYFKTFDPNKNILIIGGGSNLLLTTDFNGLVIKNNLRGIEVISEDENEISLRVGAGENWHEFVMYCVEKNYAGIENLSLIPGNVGASPMQNIGAYGIEVKEVISSVEAIEINSGKLRHFNNEECQFAYRSSVFKTSLKDKYFISSVTFLLKKKATFKIEYGAIQQQLKANGVDEGALSIKAISDAVIQIRQSKLPDPKKIGNSGSFFKNPIVSSDKKNELITSYPDMPFYELDADNIKLAAGWLIEQAGWKGYREGDYGVHEKQALVLVNYGQAKGEEIFMLSEKILNSIQEKFGVSLEREVNII